MPYNKDLKKGELAEERLRLYFLNLGYFVIRSIKAEYKGFDVTDVDLFLYSRPSPISRERTNVDVKMKQRPQALERVFWTKGLKEVLNLEKCIVATTDKRSHVAEFGAKNDVLVLDGNFMNKLDSTARYSVERLIEEEFIATLDHASIGELGGDWKKKYELAKSNLLDRLNFDGVNYLLGLIRQHLEICSSGFNSEACYRALYIYISFFLITLDYSIKDFSYKDQKERNELIADGIRFGEMGKKKSEEIITMSTALMSSFMSKSDYDIDAIKQEVLSQFMDINSNDLAEYLGSTKMMHRLLPIAIELEGQAYNRKFSSPMNTSTEIQSIIGLLCDFFSIDRKKILI
ncbi:hypothetical protein L4D08_25750 [Photobacterium chitinilyticum]|uniref:hypothetical protein n=1 Tax=Photobacterium chitinilyticum TaxID=2485123 RepID=UPI003D14AB6A